MVELYKMIESTKLEYISVVWNNLSITKSNSIEIFQRKFIMMFCDKFFKTKSFNNYS